MNWCEYHHLQVIAAREKQDRAAIARLRRRMPADALVMKLCDEVEGQMNRDLVVMTARSGILFPIADFAPMGA